MPELTRQQESTATNNSAPSRDLRMSLMQRGTYTFVVVETHTQRATGWSSLNFFGSKPRK